MDRAPDRIRRHTAASVLRRIDGAAVERLTDCARAGPAGVAERIERLDRTWDTDRTIEAEAALTGLTGLALAALASRRLLAMPAFVGAAVFVHALTGWYPLLPIMRRLGVRSAREIERERYALKVLRGDFAALPSAGDGALHGSRTVAAPGAVR